MTWNMGGEGPPEEGSGSHDALWEAVPLGTVHIIAIATQECGDISASTLNPDKSAWEAYLQKHSASAGYVLVSGHALAATHNAVLVHKHLLPVVGHVQTHAIACGVGGTLGNKGGVGIGLRVGSTSILIVSCHLASGHSKVADRNANQATIDAGLQLAPSALSPVQHHSLASRRFDRVVWCGDLNYRLDCSRQEADAWLSSANHAACLAADQLTQQRKAGLAFPGFAEGPLCFPPTYKFDKPGGKVDGTSPDPTTALITPPGVPDSPPYDTGKKQRVPSWTDRILYTPMGPQLSLLAYRALMRVQQSDHRPVEAYFAVGLKSHGPPLLSQASTALLAPTHDDEHYGAHTPTDTMRASPVTPKHVAVGASQSQSCTIQ